ncbi:MAG: DUF2569 family protein [Acidobacteria bacterium]|nr:DUF2569 family protein [Acidobacteriota bacterium]
MLLAYNILASLLPFLAGLPAEANEAMIREVATGLFRSIIYIAIWSSYLKKSKRVAATYVSATGQA